MMMPVAWLVAGLLATPSVAISCDSDDECNWDTDGKKCLLPNRQCGCTSDSQCGSYGKDKCQTSTNTCQGCLTNSDCSSGMTCQEIVGTKTCSIGCTTDSECQQGDDTNYKCVNNYCEHGMSGCEWTDEDSEEVGHKLIAGNIVGIVIAIINLVAVSLPLCCGIAKNAKAGSCEMPKLIAGIAIFVGIFVMFIPLMGTSSATEGAIDDLCEGHGCSCSEKNKDDFRTLVGAISFVIAYVYAFGWVCILLGIVAASLGCCVCCKCCGPLKDQGGGAPVQGNVVGRPVGQ